MPRIHLVTFALVALLAACGGSQQPDDPTSMPSSRSYDEAMYAEHQGEEPVATLVASTAPVATVVGADVTYGQGHAGYASHPAAPSSRGGIVLVHEWWGLNDNIRAVADRLAGEGYAVIAVDVYGGQSADTAEQARALMQQAMADPDAVQDNVRAASAWLDEQGVPSVAVMGYCFGGGVALNAAIASPDAFDAAVIYYGHVTSDSERLARIDDPVIAFFGRDDQGIPVADVEAFEAALDQVDADAEVIIYDGAGHAFANPSGERYQEDAATDAWDRTLQFLERTVAGDGEAGK